MKLAKFTGTYIVHESLDRILENLSEKDKIILMYRYMSLIGNIIFMDLNGHYQESWRQHMGVKISGIFTTQ